MRDFCNPSQSGSSECEINESWAGMILRFVGTVDNYLEKKYIYLITNSFKGIKVYNVKKIFTMVFYPLRDSIPNIVLRALRSRSCTRWLYPAPKLYFYFSFFPPLSIGGILQDIYHLLLHCTEDYWCVQGAPELSRPWGASERNNANGTDLPTGTALPLACLITFLDVQYVCSDRKLSL